MTSDTQTRTAAAPESASAAVPSPAAAPPADTYQVSQLLNKIQGILDSAITDEVWVSGEITSWREPSRMTYFTLAEPDPDSQGFAATLPVVIFPRERQRIESILQRSSPKPLTLQDGVAVRIRGRLAIYAPQGRLQLRMTSIDPAFTVGQLALQRERILAKLAAEGLLEQNRSRPLSPAPLRVALMSSFDSAAFNDIVKQLSESGFGWQVTPLNVFVQGSRSERSIVAAFGLVDSGAGAGPDTYDVVILARGGGSATDLATFDTEGVARAIAACPVPVFVGVGHETDRSVADEVAHTSCKTPTACAQTLVDLVRRFDDTCAGLWEAIAGCARWHLNNSRAELLEIGQLTQRAPRHSIALARQFLADAPRRLGLSVAGRFARDLAFIGDVPDRLARAVRNPLRGAGQELSGLDARLQALDPVKILARGWSITRRADGSVVKSAGALAGGDEIVTQLADGEVSSSVSDIRIDPKTET